MKTFSVQRARSTQTSTSTSESRRHVVVEAAELFAVIDLATKAEMMTAMIATKAATAAAATEEKHDRL